MLFVSLIIRFGVGSKADHGQVIRLMKRTAMGVEQGADTTDHLFGFGLGREVLDHFAIVLVRQLSLSVVGEVVGESLFETIRMENKPLAGTEFDIRADLVLIAIGFSGPRQGTYLEGGDFELDARTNIAANTMDYRTSVPKVYAAGDVRRGQSLVVWAIREGRQAARAIDLDLMGATTLPR